MIDGRFALFDSDHGHALLLSGYRRTLCFEGSVEHDGDLASAFEELEAAAKQGEWVALAANYSLGEYFESAVAKIKPSGLSRPLLRAWVFSHARCLDPTALEAFIDDRLAEIPEHERVAGVTNLAPALAADGHASRVEQIRRWIAEGDCYQINLTFPLVFTLYGHPWALYARLRARQSVRYGAYIVTPEETLLSFSPELFFERVGSRVVTRPMKGTAERGVTPDDDAAIRESLLASEKERAENIMIVDLLRNDLGKLARPGKVRVESLCDVEAYPTLWQVVSSVSADLPGVRLFDLFRALFPCGSITGAPKIRAMQRIAELEVAQRGLYTGSLGWLSPGGDCRFNVAIRTLEIAPDGQGKLGVGSGIVIDSSPASEYAECLLKSRFLTRYDPGFRLIETLRLECGVLQRLESHIERLRTSAEQLGFACDIAAVASGLAEHASLHATGIRRVRLMLAHDGQFRISQAVLEDYALPTLAVLAEECVDPDQFLLRHKTSARGMYDRALARLAGCPDVFDAIFLNTRGEVSEGARSNVFIERDGVWLTPPMSSGLLPGVMRRQLVESGRAIECVLFKEDLLRAPVIYLTNSVRGVIPVNLRS